MCFSPAFIHKIVKIVIFIFINGECTKLCAQNILTREKTNIKKRCNTLTRRSKYMQMNEISIRATILEGLDGIRQDDDISNTPMHYDGISLMSMETRGRESTALFGGLYGDNLDPGTSDLGVHCSSGYLF